MDGFAQSFGRAPATAIEIRAGLFDPFHSSADVMIVYPDISDELSQRDVAKNLPPSVGASSMRDQWKSEREAYKPALREKKMEVKRQVSRRAVRIKSSS
jgi:hypothetical protein